MEINQTPVRTVKHYKINNFSINEDFIFKQKIKNFNTFSVQNDNFLIKNTCDKLKIQTPLSKEFLLMSNKNSNVNLHLTSQKHKNNAHLTFNCTTETPLVDNICIICKEDTINNISILYTGVTTFRNSILKICCEKGAILNLTLISDNSQSFNFQTIDCLLKENSVANVNLCDFENKINVHNFYSELIEDNAKLNVNAMYLQKNDNQTDLNYFVKILKPNCSAYINVNGVLNDYAKKSFKGTISFEKGCKKSVGEEDEYCILLSNNCTSKAYPVLLSREEDVNGKHSSSTGKIQNNKMFYITSRGLTEQEALKLITKAKLNKQINLIEDKNIQNYIIKKIDRYFENEK